MILFIVLTGIILGLLYYAVQYRLSYWDRRGIPHDKPTFPKGNLQDWPKKKHLSVVFKDYYEKFKNIGCPFVGFFFSLTKTVVITDLELVKRVLIQDFNYFENRGTFYNEVDDPLSATLFSIEGTKWRLLRHKLSPTFTSGKMKQMFPIVVKIAKEMTDIFNEKISSDQVLEITDLLSRYTADVIGTCAFGLDCNSQRGRNADFVEMGKRAVTKRRYHGLLDFIIFGFPKLARRAHLKLYVDEVEEFYFRIVRETITYRLKCKEKHNDFMDMLIELYIKHEESNKEEGLSFKELVAQAFVFLVAGFETSSTTMGFALYELALHQNIQDKLRREIADVVGKHQKLFSHDCIKQMVYLKQVMMETLRKYPVLAHLRRKAQSDYMPDDRKYFIEKGTAVIIPSLGIHYDPNIYPEPEKFKPERFTEDEIAARPSCTWLPFGDGPRNCIGARFGLMQTCVGLAHLVKDFRFSVSSNTETPLQFAKNSVLLSAERGIRLQIEKV